jgi:tetratricopeptide (TPR) repeat protein
MIFEMAKYILLIISIFVSLAVSAQKERKYVREGNGYFEKGLKDTTKLDSVSFGQAEVAYRRALEIKPDDFHWQFNLADAIYKQNRPDQSAQEFECLLEKTDKPMEKAMLYHNLGNSLLVQKKFDPSIEAYKKALRINPADLETKYNLAYAMKMKEEDQKQQQQNKDQNKDQDQDKNKDQDKKDQDKDKQDQNKDKQDQNKDKQDQQQQQQQNKISQQNAEQILKALENDEKKTQEKVKKEQVKVDRRQIDKNW